MPRTLSHAEFHRFSDYDYDYDYDNDNDNDNTAALIGRGAHAHTRTGVSRTDAENTHKTPLSIHLIRSSPWLVAFSSLS